jgi:hypothetical protein
MIFSFEGNNNSSNSNSNNDNDADKSFSFFFFATTFNIFSAKKIVEHDFNRNVAGSRRQHKRGRFKNSRLSGGKKR